MKRKNKLVRHLVLAALAGRRQVPLAIIVPLAATIIATGSEAIVIEDTTGTLLRDMSEFSLVKPLSSFFWNTDPLSESTLVIGEGTESAQEAQEDGGIDHAYLI